MPERPRRGRLSGWLAAGLIALGCHQLDYEPRVAEGEIGIYDVLFSVSVVNEGHAVAVGYHGAAYWTDSSGEHWYRGDTDTTQLLYSVSMADSKHGWAVGQTGTILRTTDGGRSWHRQPNLKEDEGSHLFGVHAIDADSAIAVGEWGSRIFTSDGGATWEDDSVIVTVDHPMFVWLSVSDQERVREGKKVYEDVGLNNVFCLDPPSQQCWIAGEFGYVYWSDDRGRSWERGEIIGDVFLNPITLPYNMITFTDADREKLEEFAAQIEDETHLNVLIDIYAREKELADFGDLEEPYAIFDIPPARTEETVVESAGYTAAQQTADGYRLVWYHSTRKTELDQAARSRRLERAPLVRPG